MEVITVRDLFKKFDNQVVLNHISLSVTKGECVVLTGPNGAGKSTLLNALADLIEFGGEIKINGTRISKDVYLYRDKIGYVLETPVYLSHLAIKEYLFFIGSMYKIPNKTLYERIKNLIEIFELPDDKKIIEEYSKGIRSRIQLASALINNPEILILDEPFDGLDLNITSKIINFFKTFVHDGGTIFLISHDWELMKKMCTRLLILKKGVISYDKEINEANQEEIKEYLTNSLQEDNYYDKFN